MLIIGWVAMWRFARALDFAAALPSAEKRLRHQPTCVQQVAKARRLIFRLNDDSHL